MRRLLLSVLALVLLALHDRTCAQIADTPQPDAYPIIAELYDDPARYAGRSVMIYGLVVEAGPGPTFMLQDVSQHPLKIVTDRETQPAVGDQLLVLGNFHPGDPPYLSAKALIPTQVVAGGGCC